MKTMNYQKYEQYPKVNIQTRSWPDNAITTAPIWCSVDLRDGNQALNTPMNIFQKTQMFDLLVKIGFKEIEVGFPSASEIEFNFMRMLIEEERIPDDVTIQVLTQARPPLIERTFDSIKGAKKAIIHLYNSTSKVQREVVFKKGKDEIKQIAVEGTRLIRKLSENQKDIDIRLQYSPESFTGTELEYALVVCEAVMEEWTPIEANPIIINLPSTVEMSTPNLFADRIEWFCRNMKNRHLAIISVHTHNDRGCAIAASELAIMAGADRIEGALFGNGERSGNMDIMILAMNLFSQGIDPQLDFSNMNQIVDIYKDCTQMDIHPRHPYCGDLVYTAFSGSHQDAINKGMKQKKGSKDEKWNVPYLPIDPQDIGRNYEAIIKINSQSGKGGVAYVLEMDFGVHIPKWMQGNLGQIVQKQADTVERELSSKEIYDLFIGSYAQLTTPLKFIKCSVDSNVEQQENQHANNSHILVKVERNGSQVDILGEGNGPVDAFVKALEKELSVSIFLEEYAEHSIAHGSDANAISYIMIKGPDGRNFYGAGIDSSILNASMKAVLSAMNNVLKEEDKSNRIK